MPYYTFNGRLNTGLQVNSAISAPGEVDQYQTAFIKGLTYTVTAYGSSTGNGTLADPYLQLLDKYGNVLQYNNDISATNRNAQITFTAGASDNFYVNVRDAGDDAAGSYVYQISVGYASNYNDQITGTAYGDAVAGMDGNDIIWTGAGDDYIYGQGNSDSLVGGAGADYINGGIGWDSLRGQSENDILIGSAGKDTLIGGTGADRFVFLAMEDSAPGWFDVIVGGDGAAAFEGIGVTGGDVIDVSAIDANPYVVGNQAFTFSTQAGTGTAALWNDAQGNTVLGLSNDADADYEFIVKIADGGILPQQYSTSDFLL